MKNSSDLDDWKGLQTSPEIKTKNEKEKINRSAAKINSNPLL